MSEETKFTRGPWVTVREDMNDGYIEWAVVADGRGLDVARCAEAVAGRQAKHNARLISAAPDLYAALSMALATWLPNLPGCPDPECGVCLARKEQADVVRAALAKARGE